MILDGTDTAGSGPGTTLDDLFRRAGVRRPDAIALVDPPNRAGIDGCAPRTLSYAQADRAISAFAARLHGLGLPTDAVVALQTPNTVDAIVALLGVLRAGMIAAPLPLLWRQHDIVPALRGVGVRAIVAGTPELAESAMLAAAELFPIRHVCGFGAGLPDGVVPLGDVFAPETQDFVPTPVRAGQAPAHTAVITFDVTSDGIAAVARNHLQLVAGGLMPFLEARLAQDARILTAIPPASFAGLSLGVVPWLLAGGTLEMHHGGDAETLAVQCRDCKDGILVLPGPAVASLADAGMLGAPAAILALWRAPERLAAASPWQAAPVLVDVASFGEVGLVAALRNAAGLPAPIPRGRIAPPRGAAGASTAETARGKAGTLLLRGPMTPTQALPSGAGPEPSAPDPSGFVDTGFACHAEPDGFVITGPPAGTVGVGGYRFRRPTLDAMAENLAPAFTLMTVPDALLGERLAGHTASRAETLAQLQGRGVNPLISEAFGPRTAADAGWSAVRLI
jgi:hypothetical protein